MPMRDILLRKFSLANRTNDLTKSFSLYTEVLENDALTMCFSREEIGHTFYNRSIAHTEMADEHLSNSEYKVAHGMMRMALSDVRNAQYWYTEETQKAVCTERMEEYEAKRQVVISERKKAENTGHEQSWVNTVLALTTSSYAFSYGEPCNGSAEAETDVAISAVEPSL